MSFLKSLLDKFEKKRKPAEQGQLVGLTGAVVILTSDGNNVVMSPEFAEEVLQKLPGVIWDARSENKSC